MTKISRKRSPLPIGMVSLLFLLLGCNFLGFDVKDNSAPLPGLNGALTPNFVEPHSIGLTWTKATDEEDSPFSLEYAVYWSPGSDLFSTPDAVIANVNNESGWQRDISSFTILNLTPDTEYCIYVVVRDTKGEKSLYQGIIVSTAILDTEPPILTLNGQPDMATLLGQAFSDPGASAFDNVDGDLTSEIIIFGEVDHTVVGFYQLTYDVSDNAGNEAATLIRWVEVIQEDNTPPVITLLGDSILTIIQYEDFTDPGATALDNHDGDITDQIQVIGNVDTTTIGTYLLSYNVSDAAGNLASTVTRTVIVEEPDVTPPSISLLGETNITIPQFSTYNEPGVLAVDDRDGDLSGSVVVSGTVDSSEIGFYPLEYQVSDSAGNSSSILKRYVSVALPDTTPPVITLLGATTIYIGIDGTYSEPGYYATDDQDGSITDEVIITNNLDSTQEGNYEIQYDVQDASGNAALRVTRTVVVEAIVTNQAPVAVISGSSTSSDDYIYAYGGQSWDPNGDSLTFSWDVNSISTGHLINVSQFDHLNFDVSSIDTYEITLTVSDGELSDSASMTIEVHNSPPYLNDLTGSTHLNLGETGSYGYSSNDSNGDLLSVEWLIEEVPMESLTASLSNADTANGTVDFTPDVAGTYILRCTASDGIDSVYRLVSITVFEANEGGVDVIFN